MNEETFEGGGIAGKEEYAFDMIDAEAMLAMARVMWETAQTGRPRDNWRKLPVSVHINHLLIHVFKFMRGDRDEDHLAHAMGRAFMTWSVNYRNLGQKNIKNTTCGQKEDTIPSVSKEV